MKKVIIFIYIVILCILWIFVDESLQPAPQLLNIDDSSAIYTVTKNSSEDVCLVEGKENQFGVSSVFAASRNIDLQKYVGKKVYLNGKFIYSFSEAVKGCKLTDIKGDRSTSRVVLEVTDVLPVAQ